MIRVATLFLVIGLTAACGGGNGAGGKSGKTAADTNGTSNGSGRGSSGEDDADDEGEAAIDPCADGSCFRCGDGLCPKGFYCDEKAAACSWLPECASEATCGCVKQGAGDSCSCEERSGGVYARCD